MSRHHLEPRLIEGGWESFDGNGFKTGEGGIYLEPNQDYSCFSIRSTDHNGDEDLIHFCNWRDLVQGITDFMTEREKIATEDGEI
jgi:hypothetical protein